MIALEQQLTTASRALSAQYEQAQRRQVEALALARCHRLTFITASPSVDGTAMPGHVIAQQRAAVRGEGPVSRTARCTDRA